MAEERRQVTRLSLKVALALAVMLVGAIAIFAFFTRNMFVPAVEIPWFLPMMNGFLCLVSGCVAFLAFGRFAVLKDSPSFWVSIGSVGFMVGMLFNMITFPGLLPGGRSLVGSVPNTAVWMGAVALWLITVSLLLAAFAHWPTDQAWVVRWWRPVMYCWVISAIVIHSLLVRYETWLPLLIEAGEFTPLFRAVTGTFIGTASTIGTLALIRRYARTGDAIFAYVALCSIAIVGVAILSAVLVVRHDLWWYVQRTLWMGGFLAMFAGLLSEYVNLFRRERHNLQQLQVSEAKFRTLFENSAIGMGHVGFADARWIDVNASFCRMLGYTEEEMRATPWTAMTHPEDVELDLEPFRRMAAGQLQNYSVEKRFIHKRGHHVWARLNLSLVRDADGRPDYEIAVIEDITSRKRAEWELREREELLKTVLEALPVGVWVLDRGGRVTNVNRKVAEIWGSAPYTDPATYGGYRGWWVETGEPVRADEWGGARAVVRGESSSNEEVEIEAFDGSHKFLLISSTPIRNDSGDITGAVTINMDITSRKQAEQAMRKSEARFRSIFANAAVGIALFDVERRLRRANAKFCSIINYQEEELRGRLYDSFTHPDDLVVDRTRYDALMRGETDSYSVEKRYIRKDGRPVWVRVTRSVQPRGQNLPEHSITIVEDIDDRKRAEEERERLLAEVQRSNQDLQQFAYVASHDLQEPLRMVSSYMQLLERKYRGRLDEKAQTYIHYAVDGTRRMQNLIDGLLRYSRISGHLQLAPVDTNAVYAAAIANLAESIGEAGGAVTADQLPTVQGDETQLVQLFQNLIGNGLKYRKPGVVPHIHVSARREAGEWVFSVRDNGIGIDPQYFDRVFQIFQRLHTREEYPGTGIGLASCKKIVERHNGRIWLESTPGEGSTFYFTLPAEQAPQ